MLIFWISYMRCCGLNILSIFTTLLHVMQHMVLLSHFCLSVHLSVRCVYSDKTKWCTADIMIPYETAITLLFWHQHWLVGDAPFPVKYSPKVTHPCVKLIVPCNQYFICIQQMALRSRYSCLANSSASRPAQNHWQWWQLHNGLFRHRQSHGLSAMTELLVSPCDVSILLVSLLNITFRTTTNIVYDTCQVAVAYWHK